MDSLLSLEKFELKFKKRYHLFDFDQNEIFDYWRSILRKDFSVFSIKTPKKEDEIRCEKLTVGNGVEIRNANLSRWVPLLPGKLFSKSTEEIISEHRKKYPLGHEYGLEGELVERNDMAVLTGGATCRVLPYNGEYLLSATDRLCDGGIPILISDRLFHEELEGLLSKESTASANIFGTLSELPGEWKTRIEQNTSSKLLRKIYGLPHLVLRVKEIKNVGTGGDIFGAAWTQYTDTKYFFLKSKHFQVNKEESLEKAIESLISYNQFLESPLIGGKWSPIINFDETKNWFANAKYTVSSKKCTDKIITKFEEEGVFSYNTPQKKRA